METKNSGKLLVIGFLLFFFNFTIFNFLLTDEE